MNNKTPMDRMRPVSEFEDGRFEALPQDKTLPKDGLRAHGRDAPSPIGANEVAEMHKLAERMETHVVARGGLSGNHDTGEVYLPNGAWAMMLQAALDIRRLLTTIEGLEAEAKRHREAARRCAQAVAFFEKVKAASIDERMAVGTDHFDEIEHACRKAAAVLGDQT